MNAQTTLIKPCPFCSGSIIEVPSEGEVMQRIIKEQTGKTLFSFKCSDCGIEFLILAESRAETLIKLNRREG